MGSLTGPYFSHSVFVLRDDHCFHSACVLAGLDVVCACGAGEVDFHARRSSPCLCLIGSCLVSEESVDGCDQFLNGMAP